MFRLCLILSLLVFLGGCDSAPSEVIPEKVDLELKSLDVLAASDAFGWELLKSMNQKTAAGENLVMSSLSVAQALGMTINGAGGETLSQMQEMMGFEDTQSLNEAFKNVREVLATADRKVDIEIANSVWYRESLPAKESFKSVVETYFDATFRGLNFDDAEASKKVINGWVKDKTHGKISTIVEDIQSSHTMFLVNAVYFLGKWQYQFKKENTQQAPFYLADGSAVDVDLMRQEGGFETATGDRYKAVRMPYGDGAFYMVVLLPSDDSSVDQLISEMDSEKWDALNHHFHKQNMTLFLPKFETACKYELKESLEEMGMPLAFSGGADFGRMIDRSVMIGSVKHKTFIKVDEEGTEAAAVTSVEIVLTSAGPDLVSFRVDRPFFFAIAEKESGAILFAGKIENPLLSSN